jgi:hypothetical protein
MLHAKLRNTFCLYLRSIADCKVDRFVLEDVLSWRGTFHMLLKHCHFPVAYFLSGNGYKSM